MKNTIRFLTLLLTFCLLISTAACTNPPVSDSGMGTPEVTEPITEPDTSPEELPKESVVLSQEYALVLNAAHAASTHLMDAAACIQEALESVYGISATITSDRTEDGENSAPHAYEILIGETNRPQSAGAIGELGIGDYTYLVESEEVIVICGGSPASTKQAAEKFCEEVLGYKPEAEALAKTPVVIGTSYTHNESYSCTQATLNGTPVAEYTIALGDLNTEATDTAFSLARLLGLHTGERIPVISGDDLTGEEKELIVVDGVGREAAPFTDFNGYYYKVEEDEIGTLITASANDRFHGRLLSRLSLMIKSQAAPEGTAVLTIAEGEKIYYDKDGNIPTWTLGSFSSQTLCDGVEYSRQIFYDDIDLPYRTFILTIDPEKVNFHLGTTDDGYISAIPKEDVQNVVEHTQAAVANGKNIIAAVNAGFFNINTDYAPTWLAIKDGVLIGTGNPGPAFFAVTDSGEIILDYGANYGNYSDKKIMTAVSGSALILLDGKLTAQAHANDTHPRTLVGIKEDGTVILAVIDGRQLEYSNGASLEMCAVWMNSLGAVTVVNLDGGGSSTFLTRDPQTDAYTVHNSPSDGKLRGMHDSLLIEPKEAE